MSSGAEPLPVCGSPPSLHLGLQALSQSPPLMRTLIKLLPSQGYFHLLGYPILPCYQGQHSRGFWAKYHQGLRARGWQASLSRWLLGEGQGGGQDTRDQGCSQGSGIIQDRAGWPPPALLPSRVLTAS